jgi:hypothetical protein
MASEVGEAVRPHLVVAPVVIYVRCNPGERANDRDQDARPDEAGDQIADPTGEGDAQEAEQPAGYTPPYDAEGNVY